MHNTLERNFILFYTVHIITILTLKVFVTPTNHCSFTLSTMSDHKYVSNAYNQFEKKVFLSSAYAQKPVKLQTDFYTSLQMWCFNSLILSDISFLLLLEGFR